MIKLPIIDCHTDFVLTLYEKGEELKTKNQISYQQLKRAGVKIIFSGFSYDHLLGDSQKQLELMTKEFSDSEKWRVIKKAKDAKDILEKRQIGTIIHLEGGEILKGKLENLDYLYKKGLRSLGLTWNKRNCLGAGVQEDKNIPLTEFGKEVIKYCNQKGIIVDLSHLNERGFYETLELSKKPVVVTHANCYKLCPNPRNLKDEQIKAIATNKGFIGVFFSKKYLSLDGDVTIDDVIAHFKHIASLVGVDYLAIGSDFGGVTTGTPRGLENTLKIKPLLKKLKSQGFSESDIEKIAYKNALRVLKTILLEK